MRVRFIKRTARFLYPDKEIKTFGPFEKGDEISVPEELFKLLKHKELVEEVQK